MAGFLLYLRLRATVAVAGIANGASSVSRKGLAAAALLLVFALGLAVAPAHARDTSVKVLLEGQLWFCHVDPTGWSLADFKAVCSMIEPGGKGEIVEFIVDRRGKVRRKPPAPKKQASFAELGLRPSLQ